MSVVITLLVSVCSHIYISQPAHDIDLECSCSIGSINAALYVALFCEAKANEDMLDPLRFGNYARNHKALIVLPGHCEMLMTEVPIASYILHSAHVMLSIYVAMHDSVYVLIFRAESLPCKFICACVCAASLLNAFHLRRFCNMHGCEGKGNRSPNVCSWQIGRHSHRPHAKWLLRSTGRSFILWIHRNMCSETTL